VHKKQHKTVFREKDMTHGIIYMLLVFYISITLFITLFLSLSCTNWSI